jgi:nucleotide-binding universal stress UspA family protein
MLEIVQVDDLYYKLFLRLALRERMYVGFKPPLRGPDDILEEETPMAGIIIVGVDGSETSMKAARTAAQLAAGLSAELRVVTAHATDNAEVVRIGNDKWYLSDSATAEKVAKQAAGDLATEGLHTSYAALHGKPQDVLIEEAERVNAQLIVVGNVGMKGLGRVLGSVATSVAQRASCDVYIAKTDS